MNLANHSSNNTLVGNTAKENGYGIYLCFSSGWDLVFGNHLIDNGCNAYDLGQNNRWDNGSVGNYYSDLGRISMFREGQASTGIPWRRCRKRET